jgi:hypothetical protein
VTGNAAVEFALSASLAALMPVRFHAEAMKVAVCLWPCRTYGPEGTTVPPERLRSARSIAHFVEFHFSTEKFRPE